MVKRWKSVVAALVAGVASVGCVPDPGPGPSAPNPNVPVSLGAGGIYGDGTTSSASVSADANRIAFVSSAHNLSPDHENGLTHLYLRDISADSLTRLAAAPVGSPSISRNGRYVAYVTQTGIFNVYDAATATTKTWSDAPSQTTPIVTDDGRYAVYGAGSSFGLFATKCHVRDLVANTTASCPPGSPDFGQVALIGASGNGRFVLYHWNDQSGGGTSAHYLWDLSTGSRRVVPGPFLSIGDNNNVVSDDGTTIISAGFGDAMPALVHDVPAGTSAPLHGAPIGMTVTSGFSPNGRYAAIVTEAASLDPDDTNGVADVYRFDLLTDTVTRVSNVFDTGAQLQHGSVHCAKIAGQVLDDGRVCLLAADEISSVDTNGFADAYLTRPAA